ncbi:MAG TPA: NAD(+) synthase [bacterium]|nr:NAD(+) synthase [bacterium]
MNFHRGVLDLHAEAEISRIQTGIQQQVYQVLNKHGAVIALSGGIDSSVTASLAVGALGRERVLGLSLPEKDSRSTTCDLGKLLADHLQINLIREDITPALEAFGCYGKRDAAVKKLFPEYHSGYKMKIVMPQDLLNTGRLNFFRLVIEDPRGNQQSRRIPPGEFLEIVAATNHKQRTRKQYEYYYADKMNYAVLGTPNRLEYDQGFFVKGGDGLADLKPIAHLYKSQVYQLAGQLGIPDMILDQKPTTDTYNLSQTQEEFFFALPYEEMDLFLWALNHAVPTSEVASVMGYSTHQVEWVFADIRHKRKVAGYLHAPPLLIEDIRDGQLNHVQSNSIIESSLEEKNENY